MGISNAEKQRRFRERNVVVLTDDAREIAQKLVYMADQNKLRRIARYVNDHLKHPDRDDHEKAIALGRVVYTGLNGDLSKTAALKRYREGEPKPDGSWRVEATTKDGRRWENGVRLGTREEAEVYIQSHVCFDLEKKGYITAEVVRDEAMPNCNITRNRKGGRATLVFPEGACAWMGWRRSRKAARVAQKPA